MLGGGGQCSDLTMIQVDLIQMDDQPADSCAINPTAFLFITPLNMWVLLIVNNNVHDDVFYSAEVTENG